MYKIAVIAVDWLKSHIYFVSMSISLIFVAKSKIFMKNDLLQRLHGESAILTLCTAGKAEVLLNSRMFELTKGMLFVQSPLVDCYYLSKSDDYQDAVLSSKLDTLFPTMKWLMNIVLSMNIFEKPLMMVTDEQYKFFTDRVEQISYKREKAETANIKEQCILNNEMADLLERETFVEFVSMYLENLLTRPEPVKSIDDVVINFILSLHRNYASQRSVSYYAKEANLSTGHFNHIVKTNTNKSPSEWIEIITIINAKRMLLQTSMSIKEIADELNFPEQFTFGKYFKKHAGMSASEYRGR